MPKPLVCLWKNLINVEVLAILVSYNEIAARGGESHERNILEEGWANFGKQGRALQIPDSHRNNILLRECRLELEWFKALIFLNLVRVYS
jgi:hypothetical protein